METFNTQIPRALAAQYGQEAVQIIRQGAYRAPSGQMVSIADLVERSVQGTVSYPPDRPLPQTHVGPYRTGIEVVNETTLAAVRRLRDTGHHPVALNFASATHPGGRAIASYFWTQNRNGLWLRHHVHWRFSDVFTSTRHCAAG